MVLRNLGNRKAMIKVFISHSSKQKDFVKDLVGIIGRDHCIVDCYDFEPAYKTIDEICEKISQSTAFVLLISKDSLNSSWVTQEVTLAQTKFRHRNFDGFWPYIIDKEVEISDCPKWLSRDECFNLKVFPTAKALARDIKQKVRRCTWEKSKFKKHLDTLMVGRNADIEKFEDIYQSERGMKLRALIVSGREGVGKDMFISKCMDKMGYSSETIPFSFSLGAQDGIEDFIIQLNHILAIYDESQLVEVLTKEPTEKAKIAASMVNELLLYKTVLVVDDDFACVQPNRKLADWLTDMVENNKIDSKLGLFIKSRIIPHSFVSSTHPLFSHIHLEPLGAKDRTKLFYSLLRSYQLEDITENDVQWFVDKLLLSPYQLVKAVERLSQLPLRTVKRDIDGLTTWGDNMIKPMVSYFFNDERKRQILVILSKIEFVSYDILERFFTDEIDEVMKNIDEMMDYGIVTAFGPNENFFRLDHYLSDYINRCRISLPSHLESEFEEILESKIAESSFITEDTSVYLYDTKRKIMSGRGNMKDFLIPSVVINAVMEIYNKKDYKQVIRVCDKVMSDIHNYFEDQEKELKYWLCLSLARMVNNRFYAEINFFQKNSADYCFLRGFYHRNAMEYSQAEDFFDRALEKSPHLQRAKREKVTVLLAQKKYEEALELAEENYEKNPENSYQIYGYFRCLVRKKKFGYNDVKMLENLMNAMKENLSDKHEELYAAMDIEFQDYVQHMLPTELLAIIKEAEKKYPNSLDVRRAAQTFKLRQSIISKEENIPEEC